jgi:hypothetical protein
MVLKHRLKYRPSTQVPFNYGSTKYLDLGRNLHGNRDHAESINIFAVYNKIKVGSVYTKLGCFKRLSTLDFFFWGLLILIHQPTFVLPFSIFLQHLSTPSTMRMTSL